LRYHRITAASFCVPVTLLFATRLTLYNDHG